VPERARRRVCPTDGAPARPMRAGILRRSVGRDTCCEGDLTSLVTKGDQGAPAPRPGRAPIGRVMYVSSSGNMLGGAENALFDIVTSAQRDWEPIVVVPFEGELAASLRRAGVECHVVGIGVLRHRGELRSPILVVRLLGALIGAGRLMRLIRKRDIRIVHSNTSTVIAGALSARLTRVPHVWHVREMLSGPAWSLLGRLILLLSSRVVCISQTVASNLPHAGHTTRVVVVPDGINLATFSFKPHTGTTGQVLMIARIHPHKGHELFIRAAASVAATVEGATFDIIGGCLPVYEPLQRHLVDLVEQLGLQAKLRFSPHVERQEVGERIRSADVVVVPSTWLEPGGLVVLEAMAAGTSVIATRRGGPAEVITDGSDGLLVSHEDPAELANAVTRLLLEPALRARLTQNAHKRVEENYTLALHVARLGDTYRSVLPHPGGSACA
jgi:glycosyltransferase involved in cell wall biosynthesis